MAHTTTMRERRMRGMLAGLRFHAALVCTLAAVAAACVLLTRDIDWPARNRDARLRGHTAENNGDYPLARASYEEALACHPYDWETHLQLADLLNHRLGVRDEALRHYLLALAYSPDPSIAQETETKIRILRLFRAGELEDPRNALDDMFAAAGAGAKTLFLRRLDAGARAGGERLWEEWRTRGRGRVGLGRVEEGRNGAYEAVLEVRYPDGTTAPVRMRCLPRDVWRMRL